MDLAAHDLSDDAVRVGAARNVAGRLDALAAVHIAVKCVDRVFQLVVERRRRRGALVDEPGEVRVELFFEVGRVRLPSRRRRSIRSRNSVNSRSTSTASVGGNSASGEPDRGESEGVDTQANVVAGSRNPGTAGAGLGCSDGAGHRPRLEHHRDGSALLRRAVEREIPRPEPHPRGDRRVLRDRPRRHRLCRRAPARGRRQRVPARRRTRFRVRRRPPLVRDERVCQARRRRRRRTRHAAHRKRAVGAARRTMSSSARRRRKDRSTG